MTRKQTEQTKQKIRMALLQNSCNSGRRSSNLELTEKVCSQCGKMFVPDNRRSKLCFKCKDLRVQVKDFVSGGPDQVICSTHGVGIGYRVSNGSFRCKKCRSEAVSRRRKKLKEVVVAASGGRCQRCGYDRCIEALDFHHEDPSQKEFQLSARGLTRSIKKIMEEVKKCLLLCSNCHREKHAGLW